MGEVLAADHGQVLRLLAKRNIDIGNQRTRVVCRLHNLVMELSPGGIAKELNAAEPVGLLECVQPATPVEAARRDLARELLADVQRLNDQLTESHRRIRSAITASRTSLTDLFGVGPIIACSLIGFSGDVSRFTSRDRYAPTTGPRPSSDPPAGGSSTASPNQATDASTTHGISPPSARSASGTPRAAPTSTPSSPRARPTKTPSVR